MDTTQLEVLEQYVQQLLLLLARVQDDNSRLAQRLAELQHTPQEPPPTLAAWDAAQVELHDLRTVTQTLRQERELIRTKLEAMLGVIEHLEDRVSASGKL